MYEVMADGEGEVDDELVKKAKLHDAPASKSSLAKVLSFAKGVQTHAFLDGERLGLKGDEDSPVRVV